MTAGLTPPPLKPVGHAPRAGLYRWGEFALLALMAMEAFWITDWYDALVRPRVGWAGVVLSLVLVLALSHLLARVIAHFHLKIGLRRLIFVLWIGSILLLSLWLVVYAGEPLSPAEFGRRIITSFVQFGSDLREFWHLLIFILVIFRGLSLAREPLQVYDSQASFQLGLFLLLVYGLVFSWEKSTQAIVTTYGFLFCAIVSMSAARISTLSELRGGRLPPLKAGWFWGILVDRRADCGDRRWHGLVQHQYRGRYFIRHLYGDIYRGDRGWPGGAFTPARVDPGPRAHDP